MKNRSFGKPLLLAFMLCAVPVAMVVTGCGGGNGGPTQPGNTFVGNYTGVYRVTAGPDSGETAQFALVINTNGSASGSVTDAGGNSAPLSGTANTTSGAFTLTGIFDATGTTGRASGTLTNNNSVVTGTGTFQLSNGNSGTVTLTKS